MDGLVRVLSLDAGTGLEDVSKWSTPLLVVGDEEFGVFYRDSPAYQVVCVDPQPYEHEGEVMDGGRIWWRRVR